MTVCQYPDLELMCQTIHKIAEERRRNDIQDVQIQSLLKRLDLLETQNTQEQLDALRTEVRIVLRDQAERIRDWESEPDPYSDDGSARCNSTSW